MLKKGVKKKKSQLSAKKQIFPTLFAGRVMEDILQLHMQYHMHSTKQTKFLTAITGLILTGAISILTLADPAKMHYLTKAGIVFIVISALAAVLISVLAEKPPSIKKSKEFHPLAYEEITEGSLNHYIKLLKELVADKDKIIEGYAYEIFHLKHELNEKIKKVRLVTTILLVGLIVGFGLVVISFLIAGPEVLSFVKGVSAQVGSGLHI